MNKNDVSRLEEEFVNDTRTKDLMRDSFKDGAEFGYNKGNEQLTKAKEIIKDYLTIVKGSHITVCGVSGENHTIHVLKLNEEAERFIREEENDRNRKKSD